MLTSLTQRLPKACLRAWALGCVALLVSPSIASADAESEAAASALFDEMSDNAAQLRMFLQAMPKGGDLHNHLGGSIYAEDFLEAALEQAEMLIGQHNLPDIDLLGPVPSPMERRAGRHRAQLLLQAAQRSALHQLVHMLLPLLEQHPLARKVRWSIDIDPLDMF